MDHLHLLILELPARLTCRRFLPRGNFLLRVGEAYGLGVLEDDPLVCLESKKGDMVRNKEVRIPSDHHANLNDSISGTSVGVANSTSSGLCFCVRLVREVPVKIDTLGLSSRNPSTLNHLKLTSWSPPQHLSDSPKTF